MKKVNVIGKTSSWEFIGEEVDAQAWIAESLSINSWGKPEREIVALSEAYDEADILSTRTEEIDGVTTEYVTLKAEYVIEVEDITEAYNAEQALQQTLANGQRAEAACKQVKAYVTGYNMSRSMTSEEVSSFVATFGTIQLVLDANRPNTARVLIEAVSVDGAVVTQTLKDNCLLILTRHGF